MSGLQVRVEHVSHVYPADGEHVRALDDVSLTIEAGGRATVVGPSGSGKSTLLAVLAGLQRPTAGRILVGDVDVTTASEGALLALRRRIAVVVQDSRRNLLPYGTAADNIRFAQRADRRARRRSPGELLGALGLAELADAPVDRLSGGERQRVAIAAGLALDPGVLLVDEPTSALDGTARDTVVALLENARRRGTTLLTITHDPLVAERLGAVSFLRGGRLESAT